MPRTSNLRFTEQQENDLAPYLLERLSSLQADNQDRINVDQEAWRRYKLDVKNRLNIQSSIWRLSNLPVPVFPMVMEHFVSRCEDATIGEKPYFHFEAVGNADARKTMLYDRYFNWKLDDQARVHEALQDKQLSVFIQKATIQKAVYDRQVARWIDREKRILYDKAKGEPVEILGFGPVIEKDRDNPWFEQLDPIQPPPLSLDPGALPEGVPPAPKTRWHLQVDPTVILENMAGDGVYEWKLPPDGIDREEIIYAGAKSQNVLYDRFLCPIDAKSVDEADVVCELDDKPLTWYRKNWLERPWCRWADYESTLKSGDATPKTGIQSTQNSPDRQPEARSFDRVNPVRRVLEFWVRRDVLGNGNGEPQEFVCFLDPELKKLIYYEYQAKVCPDFKRPYTITAIGKIGNSWCGVSIWERAKEIFESVDRLFNGEFFRSLQQANPPKGGDPTVAVEEPKNIEYDPIKYYELQQGKTMDDLLTYAKVPDTNQRSHMVAEFMIFWLQLWLGISNIAQGDYAAIPENSTKYGIQKTLQEASMLGRRWIRRVISSDEDHLTKLVLITIVTLPENQKETFEFADGDSRQAAELDAAEIRSLRMHVTLVMSQKHEEQMVERAQTALAAQEKYFLQLSPEVRAAMRPLLLEILTSLGYKDVEALLPAVQAMPLHPSMMGGEPLQNAALAGAAPPVAPNVSGTPPATAPAPASPA